MILGFARCFIIVETPFMASLFLGNGRRRHKWRLYAIQNFATSSHFPEFCDFSTVSNTRLLYAPVRKSGSGDTP